MFAPTNSAYPVGMAASVLRNWIGLGSQTCLTDCKVYAFRPCPLISLLSLLSLPFSQIIKALKLLLV